MPKIKNYSKHRNDKKGKVKKTRQVEDLLVKIVHVVKHLFEKFSRSIASARSRKMNNLKKV